MGFGVGRIAGFGVGRATGARVLVAREKPFAHASASGQRKTPATIVSANHLKFIAVRWVVLLVLHTNDLDLVHVWQGLTFALTVDAFPSVFVFIHERNYMLST